VPCSQEVVGVGAEEDGGCPPSGTGGAASCCCTGKDACTGRGPLGRSLVSRLLRGKVVYAQYFYLIVARFQAVCVW
jgi:hypothetical protein